MSDDNGSIIFHCDTQRPLKIAVAKESTYVDRMAYFSGSVVLLENYG